MKLITILGHTAGKYLNLSLSDSVCFLKFLNNAIIIIVTIQIAKYTPTFLHISFH